jgi:hypothetical protein
MFRDVSGATPDVADRAPPANSVGESREQLAVQRLVAQLVEDALDVVVGDGVVAARDLASLLQSPTSGTLDA